MHLTNDAKTHDNLMNNYKIHMNYTCVQGSQYKQDLDYFELKYKKEGYAYSIDSFLDFLSNEEKLTTEYCLHLEYFFNQVYTSGIITQIKCNQFHTILSFYLVKNEYCFNDIERKGMTDYKSNNFNMHPLDIGIRNAVFTDIKNKGAAIWLNIQGKVCIRFSESSVHKEYTLKQANVVLTNFMSYDIQFTNSDPEEDITSNGSIYIRTNDLILVQGNIFNTEVNEEFVCIDGLYYINNFRSSELLQLNKKPGNAPIAIFSLMLHLVNYDIERFFIFINWIAYFFQFLKKSQVAILFKGKQGAGKGTFFKIIEMLFNPKYCKQINGDSLKSNYLGSFIEDTLFLNFDEINHKTIGKGSFNSFLKAIITNDEVTSEKKGINMARPTKVFAQTILFSNVEIPIEIELSDRRFTVLTTAGNIKETNFFGYGSFENLENIIIDEIEDFAMYLKLYKVNKNQANSVFDTQERELMINRTENNLQWFVDAILTSNLQYFQGLQDTNLFLYNIFLKQLFNYRVFQKHLILIYTALYPNDNHIETANSLITSMEKIAPHIFGNHNIKKTNGDKYYSLMVEDIMDPIPNFNTLRQ